MVYSTVESVDSFVYLSSLQSSGWYCSPELRRCIYVSARLYDGFSSSCMEGSVCLHQDPCLPVTHAGCMLRKHGHILGTDIKQLETSHMKCQRQILDTRWFKHTSNDTALSVTGLTRLNDILANVVVPSLVTSPFWKVTFQQIWCSRLWCSAVRSNLPGSPFKSPMEETRNRWLDHVRVDSGLLFGAMPSDAQVTQRFPRASRP